ncbi:MAG: outer membrane beta-barrel protein [Flavobacteriales bacterium]
MVLATFRDVSTFAEQTKHQSNMKKLTLGLAAFAIAGGLMAQSSRFSLGAELAFPMGDFGKGVGVGIGGTLGFELPVGDNLGLMAQAGYISFSGKDYSVMGVTIKSDATGIIPIQVGAKYYFTDNQDGLYLGVLTGVHMTTYKVPEYNSTGTQTGTKTESNSDFSLAPLLGIVLAENFDLSLRYQLMFSKREEVVFNPSTFTFTTNSKTTTNGYLGLRLAYMFGGR